MKKIKRARSPKRPALTSLRDLATEQPNARTAHLDKMPTARLLRAINREDATVHRAVARAMPQIVRVVDAVAARLKNGGRLIYVGAGTSGRLGCVDASEMPPTYGVPRTLVQAIIAGGYGALRRSIEGAEDDGEAGAAEIRARKIGARDAVIGLSASGRAAFVREALLAAAKRGAFTACLTCNRNSPLIQCAQAAIVVETGAEVIAGSTRMKAGTAQKLVLNMISTASMVRLGRVRGNRMAQLKIKCEKLRERAALLVMDETGVSYEAALSALKKSRGSIERATALLRRKFGGVASSCPYLFVFFYQIFTIFSK